MSRVLFYDDDNMNVGETVSMVDLSHQLEGSLSTSGGQSFTLNLPDEVAGRDYLQLGRMAYVPGDSGLPGKAGMMDTPWQAVSPVQAVFYNDVVLLSIRCPDVPRKLNGSLFDLVAQMIGEANGQEELYVRMGRTSGSPPVFKDWPMSQKTFWSQISDLCRSCGFEIVARADISTGQLFIYLDIADTAGVATGYEFDDGAQEPNLKILSASIERRIINRLVGIDTKSTAASRLITAPFVNATSASLYRKRGEVRQFKAPDIGTLNAMTAGVLAQIAYPALEMTVEIVNKNNAFQIVRLGNTALFHAHALKLPGGRAGWRGLARITAFDYLERTRTVQMKIEAPYSG